MKRAPVVSEKNVKAVLQSFLYELARDHTLPGVINPVIENSSLPVGKYTDKGLSMWAARKADQILEIARKQEEEEKTMNEPAAVKTWIR